MNQRFRPLICLFALALLAAFSSDAVAAVRPKQTHHAKKGDAGRKHHAAHKKGKQTAQAAQRKSAKSADAPAPAAAAAPLSGDLAAVRQPKGSSNGSSCATPTGRRISTATRPSLPITHTGRA